MDVLLALDLVVVNRLAFIGKQKTIQRSNTNRLRRFLWDGLSEILDERFGSHQTELKKPYIPIRRGEASGFVIRK